MLSREQAQAITRLVHLLRPAWNEEGIYSALAKVQDRDQFEVALAALRAAHDPKAQTPGVIPSPGPHWNEEAPKPRQVGRIEPKRDEACATCGRREDTHGSPWLKDHLFLPLTHATRARAMATDRVQQIRAEIRPTLNFDTAQESNHA